MYGISNFKKEVLHIFNTEEEMNVCERELLTEEFISSSTNYNSAVGGEGGPHFKGRSHSIEARKKISKIAKTRVMSSSTREKISESNRRRVASLPEPNFLIVLNVESYLWKLEKRFLIALSVILKC